MLLSFDEWKTKLQSRWQAWTADPRAMLNALGANSLYLGLAGTALYPIAEAVARGDLAALGLLYTLGANVGVNLIANSIQHWKNESDAACQLVATVPEHPELVTALDAILQKLDAIAQVQSGLSPADRDWFARTLQADAAHFKSALAVGAVTNTGDGSIAIGQRATSAGKGGIAISRDLAGGANVYNVAGDMVQEKHERMVQSGVNVETQIVPTGETASTEIAWSERSDEAITFFEEACQKPNLREHELLKLFYDWSLVTDPHGGHLTVVGALLFCPDDRIPKTCHADVQIDNRIAGRIRNLHGYNLLNMYKELQRELSPLWEGKWEDINKRDSVGRLVRIGTYPRDAVIEALVNFIIHRDYRISDLGYITIENDFVEFKNPGVSSYSSGELLTTEEPLQPKYERNQAVIEMFSRTALNQRRGGGILKIRRLLQENGHIKDDGVPAIEIENDTKRARFRLRMYARREIVITSTAIAPASAESLRIAYLNWMLTSTRNVPLAGVDPKAVAEDVHADLDLAAVYTSLNTLRAEATLERGLRPDRAVRRLSALEVLNAEQHLVLLGNPGSGKSTFINFVTLCLAGENLGHPVANLERLIVPLPQAEESQLQPWEHGQLVPIRVVLRDLAARGLPPVGQVASGDMLWKFIVAELPETLREFAAPLRQELLDYGGLVMLDGLDEVPEADQRRDLVRAAVQGFVAMFPRARVLVTSRIYAYQKQAWKMDGFVEVVLAPFERGQIRRFVEGWYAHVGPLCGLSTDEARGRAVLLNTAIEHSARLAELATRPLLLTLMASLHAWRGGTLPEQREELYADAVELLLDQWEGQKVRRGADGQPQLIQPSLAEWLKVDQKAMRALLNRIAFEAHRDQPDLIGTADVAQDRLVRELMRLATNPDARPQRLIEHLSVRSGLLEPRGIGVYAFPHRTFQEYLAACHLADHDFPDELARLLRAEPNRWREVVLLAGAKASRGTATAAWLLAEALCYAPCAAPASREPQPEADYWAALLAAQVLMENNCLANVAERNRSKVEHIRGWLVHCLTLGALPPVDRAEVGRALSVVGDPRDLEELVAIPAGKFWMGDQKGSSSFVVNDPQHQVDLPAFKIAKYPVTAGQWKRFVEATHYKGDANALKGYDNHPVVYVSWRDAQAFCRWLTDEWHKADKIGKNEIVRLPAEAEWEKVARDNDRRDWPWGNTFDVNKANTGEGAIGGTSAVGCFSSGASLYGCLDMAGNVWEWTQSKSAKYPYKSSDGREEWSGDAARVVRGGSWKNNHDYARCAYRYNSHPDLCFENFGFRVVVSPGSRS